MEVNKIILYFGWIEKRVSDLATKFLNIEKEKYYLKLKIKNQLATGLIKVYILSNYNINFEVNLGSGWFFSINSRL